MSIPVLRRACLAAAALVALGACDRLPSDSGARPESLLLVQRVPGDSARPFYYPTDIFRAAEDGAGLENLTQYPAVYRSLSRSPDGRRLAFGSDREMPGGWTSIYVMNADGTGLTVLSGGSAPRWSPDGEWIAFQTPGAGTHVAVMRPDGSEFRTLSEPVMDDEGCDGSGSTRIGLIGWMPGSTLAFYRYVCGEGYRFYTVHRDGSGLARTDVNLLGQHWSPDGTRVARSPDGVLQTMDADGSGVRILTPDSLHANLPGLQLASHFSDHSPWSPDGRRIAFTHRVPGSSPCAAYVVNADGSELRRLGPYCEFAGWSRDGKRLALISHGEPGLRKVFAVNADGSGAVDLIGDSPATVTAAMWMRN